MKWLRKLLAFFKPKPEPVMMCMRQSHTWNWPAHLGEMTAGTCEQCGEPIYFEAQNVRYRKICHICAGM